MNAFQVIADWLHVIAIGILLAKMFWTKSCLGVSGRSQLLFTIAYVSRYADIWLDWHFFSIYNIFMKLIFIYGGLIAIFLIFVVFRKTYQYEKDVYLTELLLFTSIIEACLTSYTTSITEILWTFSIYLEPLAIIPQLYMISKSKQIDKMILYYLVALGLYRTMYIPNWLHRYIRALTTIYWDKLKYMHNIGGLIHIIVYIGGTAICYFKGVKVINEDKEARLKRNIFFISTKKPLDTTYLISDPISTEKKENLANDIE